MIEEKIVLRIVNETQADLKKFANLYKKTISDAQKEQRRVQKEIQKTTENLKKQNQELKEAQKVTKQALAPLVGASRESTKEVNRLTYAIFETQGKLAALNKEQQKYRNIIKSENKLLKDNTEQQNKLNNTKQGIVAMGDAARETTRRLQSLSKILLTVGLSSLFAGLALRNFGLKILRSLFNTFQQVTEGTSAYSETVGKLQAAFEFLKFTIIDTFLASEAGQRIFNGLVELFNKISEFIQNNPDIATAIIGGSAGLTILGTALFVFGQLASALSGLTTFFTEASKTAPLATKEIQTIGKAAGLADSKVKGLVATFSEMIKKVKAAKTPTTKLTTLIKAIIPASILKSGGKFLRILGKFAVILSIIEPLFNFFKGFFDALKNPLREANKENEDFTEGLNVLSGVVRGLLNFLDQLFELVNDLAYAFGTILGDSIANVIEKIGGFSNAFQEARESGKGFLSSVGAGISGAASSGNTTTSPVEEINKAATSGSDKINQATNNAIDAASSASTTASATASIVRSVFSGTSLGKTVSSVSKIFGSIKSKLNLARGGIVTSPTTALIGEAGPEAVIPLSRMGETNVGGINVTVNVSQTNASPEMIGNAVLDTLQQSLRRKGLSAGL